MAGWWEKIDWNPFDGPPTFDQELPEGWEPTPVEDMTPEQRAQYEGWIKSMEGNMFSGRTAKVDDPDEGFATDDALNTLKRNIVQAYEALTRQPMPDGMLAQLGAARNAAQVADEFQAIASTLPNPDLLFRVFTQIRNGGITDQDPREDLLIPIEGDPDHMIDAEGNVVDTPAAARPEVGGGTVDPDSIPPVETVEERFILGRPPEGFIPGIGSADYTEDEIAEARARQGRVMEQSAKDRFGRFYNPREPELLEYGKVPDEEDIQYYEGEEWQFSWSGPQNIRSIQERMERAGLLKPETYLPGLWDKASATAMANLMVGAYSKNLTWEQHLLDRLSVMTPEILAELYGSSAARGRNPFTAPAYRAPDLASLSQGVKGLMRATLKREPTARELAELTGQMDSDYRKEYNIEVQALRQEYSAVTEAIDTEEETSSGEVRTVDPAARFRESFEDKYSGAISLNEESDEFVERSAKMQGAMGRFDAMIGF